MCYFCQKNIDGYVPKLYEEVKQFQIDNNITHLDISASNLMSRINGEPVLIDLLTRGITPGYWVSDTIEGNAESLTRVLVGYKYEKEIKEFVTSILNYFKSENVDIGSWEIPKLTETHYQYSNISPAAYLLLKIYRGYYIYHNLKEYLLTKNIDIKTYIPPLSEEGFYWEKYEELSNQLKNLDILKLIIPNLTLPLEQTSKFSLKNVLSYDEAYMKQWLTSLNNTYNYNNLGELRYLVLYYLKKYDMLDQETINYLEKTPNLANQLM